MADERDDPNPRAPVPAGTAPPPRRDEKPGNVFQRPRAPTGRVRADEIDGFLRDYERRMGITRRPKLSRETTRKGT